eukprot:CAMPEP_0182446600 /NCGR_PEP_ID=MMETSP1172-20130603/4301_1 /TAXON_ID=708627 /ORGANISM="Timspurckia oligopyrenoides, Strain CCMP3278" /LENGTH=179 /DNA_ID=CAMNT_0024642551 /DNA_START=248 /DNA_END=784 /DNA_ORIENTATION=-
MAKAEIESYVFSKISRPGCDSERIQYVREQVFPSLFEDVGQDAVWKLANEFYSRIYSDSFMIEIFAASTKDEAIQNQFEFLVQLFGGPKMYASRKGKYTRLVSRHAAYQITEAHAVRWLLHMESALNTIPSFSSDEFRFRALMDYFSYTAYWIVFGVQQGYVNRGQPSGATTIDSGRNW